MNCIIGEEGLECTTLESHESVDIFFISVGGAQRPVVSCARFTENYNCYNEYGFSTSLKNPTQVLVTVPDALKRNGSFFCRVADTPDVTCQWNEKDYSTKGQPQAMTNEIMMGLCALFAVFITVVVVIAFRKSKPWKIWRHFNDRNTSENSIREREEAVEILLLEKAKQTAMLQEEQIKNAEKTLSPKQIALLKQSPSRVFLTGQHGKTTMLLLIGREWLQQGKEVYIVGSCMESHEKCVASCFLLGKIEQHLTSETSTKIHLFHCDFDDDKEVEEAVNNLSQGAEAEAEEGGKSLYVIAYKVGPLHGLHFPTFCDKLLAKVPLLHLWAASCDESIAPKGYQIENLGNLSEASPINKI